MNLDFPMQLLSSAMAPFMPSAAGVSTSSLRARQKRPAFQAHALRHRQDEFVAARGGNECQRDPVLPLVGSMMVVPGLRRPSFSAAEIIAAPIRSFTLPSGLLNSPFSAMDRRQSRRNAGELDQRGSPN